MELQIPFSNQHIQWLTDTGKTIQTTCGREAKVFCFSPDQTDDTVMSAWAKHFRNHYCDDNEIDELKEGMGLSREQYLLKVKFPVRQVTGKHEKTGPATRSGDFAELLVSDYLEFILNYWVPRTRYEFKVNPNLSENGSDSIGFKISADGNELNDELLVYEVKAALTAKKPVNKLQAAVDDSSKDSVRIAESLNAMKQRLRLKGNADGARQVQRFQNPTDRPYVENYGAAAVITCSGYSNPEIEKTDASKHSNADNLQLIVIKGEGLMDLAHSLYERAANEA